MNQKTGPAGRKLRDATVRAGQIRAIAGPAANSAARAPKRHGADRLVPPHARRQSRTAQSLQRYRGSADGPAGDRRLSRAYHRDRFAHPPPAQAKRDDFHRSRAIVSSPPARRPRGDYREQACGGRKLLRLTRRSLPRVLSGGLSGLPQPSLGAAPGVVRRARPLMTQSQASRRLSTCAGRR